MIVAAAAALGVMSSAHCVAMCGPLVLLAGGPPSAGRLTQMARAGLYHLGRVTTYSCLGLAAGSVGHVATSLGMGRAVAIAGGVILITTAMASVATRRSGAVTGTLMPLVARLSRAARGVGSRHPRLGLYVLGLANGLLPCGMVYAALAIALTAGSAIHAAATMAAFGAATAPALIATSLASGLIRGPWRHRLGAALPLGIAATGVLLVVRGLTAGCH
jgi:sulfite exporter TauE/SafE